MWVCILANQPGLHPDQFRRNGSGLVCGKHLVVVGFIPDQRQPGHRRHGHRDDFPQPPDSFPIGTNSAEIAFFVPASGSNLLTRLSVLRLYPSTLLG